MNGKGVESHLNNNTLTFNPNLIRVRENGKEKGIKIRVSQYENQSLLIPE